MRRRPPRERTPRLPFACVHDRRTRLRRTDAAGKFLSGAREAPLSAAKDAVFTLNEILAPRDRTHAPRRPFTRWSLGIGVRSPNRPPTCLLPRLGHPGLRSIVSTCIGRGGVLCVGAGLCWGGPSRPPPSWRLLSRVAPLRSPGARGGAIAALQKQHGARWPRSRRARRRSQPAVNDGTSPAGSP